MNLGLRRVTIEIGEVDLQSLSLLIDIVKGKCPAVPAFPTRVESAIYFCQDLFLDLYEAFKNGLPTEHCSCSEQEYFAFEHWCATGVVIDAEAVKNGVVWNDSEINYGIGKLLVNLVGGFRRHDYYEIFRDDRSPICFEQIPDLIGREMWRDAEDAASD